MTDTLIGQTINGRYKLIKQLGQGGMGQVYLARQESLDREVAIKLMHPFLSADKGFLQRFKREAKAIAALSHPHIVHIHDFDTYDENVYYLVMEYLKGGTLKELLETQTNPLPLERVIEIILQVLDGLAYAHAQGIVHRDIKPANIMLDSAKKVVITDFGLVKLIGADATTQTLSLMGSPSYMSPERALYEPGDGRSDIYSVGIILYQMTTGELPYTADSPSAIIKKHLHDPIPTVFAPHIPPSLQKIIQKALAKDPNQRYQTAQEMAAALQAVQSPPKPVPDQPPLQPVNVQPPSQKQPTQLKWIILAGISIILIVPAFFLVRSLADAQPTPTPLVIALPTDTPRPTTTPPPTQTAIPTQTPSPPPTATHTPSPTHTPQPPPSIQATILPQLQITTSNANLRQGPGTAFNILAFLQAGDVVTVVAKDETGDWFNVQLADQRLGWISATVVQWVGADQTTTISIAVTIPVAPSLVATSTSVLSTPDNGNNNPAPTETLTNPGNPLSPTDTPQPPTPPPPPPTPP